RSARRSTRAPETLPVPLALANRIAPGTDQHAIAGGDGAGIERQDELAPGSPRGAGTPASRVVPRLAVDDPGGARPGRAVGRTARGSLCPVARAVTAGGRWRTAVGRAARGALAPVARAVAARGRRRTAVGRTAGRALGPVADAVAACGWRRRPGR